ncbi:MAG: transposase [Pseudomonadota bacterium]
MLSAMPRARKHLVCVSSTPYYHVVSRCVRRAFLCGADNTSGKDYEHRRGWIEKRVRVLSSLFSIKVCAYAIMSNHYHLVVKLSPDEAAHWSDDEVLERWTALFRGPLLVQQYRDGKSLTPIETDTLRATTAVYRARLSDLSWFMKCLNEPIARKANAEDGCTGHFWEARFRSQALCTERALLAAMAYVDLNPIRARLADKPEQSDYTSLQARVAEHETTDLSSALYSMLHSGDLRHTNIATRPLMPFLDSTHQASDTLPIRGTDYLTLVDTAGRLSVCGKRGRISPALAPILARLGVSAEQWLPAATAFRDHYWNGDLRLKQPA